VPEEEGRVVGRYALHAEIASGGMARVHLGRLVGPVGFARIVAIKRLHPHFASDPEFVAMFLDEARVAARIRHPNVVPTLDVVALKGELFLVLEYVRGESLSRLLSVSSKSHTPIPPPIISSIVIGLLEGLHAAHEARSERGQPLGIVHRDVSPANVIVGSDGVARVLDFGVAKAAGRIQTTRDGQLKGKVAYMAPEQVEDNVVDRRADVWAASVVLWELVALQRLFASEHVLATMRHILEDKILPPSFGENAGSTAFDEIALRGLARRLEERYATAREMAIAIEHAVPPATARTVGAWVEATAGEALLERTALVEELESSVHGRPEVRPSLTLNSRLAAALADNPDPLARTAETVVVARTARAPAAPPPPPAPVAPSMPPPAPSAPPPPMPVDFGGSTAITPRPPMSALARALVGLAAGFLIVLTIWAIRHVGVRDTLAPRRPPPPASAELPPPDLGGLPSGSTPPPPATGAPSATTSARSHKTAPAAPACNPPYTVGPPPDFIRKPKPECFAH
jgi:serine/threonine-protein kinase